MNKTYFKQSRLLKYVLIAVGTWPEKTNFRQCCPHVMNYMPRQHVATWLSLRMNILFITCPPCKMIFKRISLLIRRLNNFLFFQGRCVTIFAGWTWLGKPDQLPEGGVSYNFTIMLPFRRKYLRIHVGFWQKVTFLMKK